MTKTTDNYNEERLGKIIQLAKHGIGGEKANAIKKVKELCRKYDLDFNEMMDDEEKLLEYSLKYKLKEEQNVLAQVILRYAHWDDIKVSTSRKLLYFYATKETYIETLNAWETLLKLWRKEKKKILLGFMHGFLDKHNLYYQYTEEERKKNKEIANVKKETEAERKARMLGSRIADSLEDADIMKRLTSRT